MAVPTIGWDESKPAGNRARSLGDDDICEFKKQVREVIAVDHIMESSGNDTDWGYHNKCTFIEQASDPANVANTVIIYAKNEAVKGKAALYLEDEDGTVTQLTEQGNFIAGITKEIRMWSGTIATLPTGWLLCNGASSTPDLRNKFIVAADADDAGVAKTTITGSALATGGTDSHVHAAGSYASVNHPHNIATQYDSDGSVSGGPPGLDRNAVSGGVLVPSYSGAGSGIDAALSYTETSGGAAITGTSASGTAIPTFYALAFMMKS